MSKTVIIPECMNPFEVMIDGKYYSYPAGTTQEVPDDVAAVIESHKQTHEAQMTPPSADLPGVCLLAVDMTLRKLGVSEETKQTAILPEMVLTAENYSVLVGINGCFLSPRFVMESGKKYRIVVDGLELDYVAEYLTMGGGLEGFIAGNWGVLDASLEDLGGVKGWPWLIAASDSMGMYGVGFIDPAENAKSHTMAVYEIAEEVNTIEPKYLLPSVEIVLDGTPTTNATPITDTASIAALDALAESNAPLCVMTAHVGSSTQVTAFLVKAVAQEGAVVFGGITAMEGAVMVTLMKYGSTWVIAVR